MASPNITPKHPAIVNYYKDRQQLTSQEVTHEMAVRESFKALFASVASLNKWTLVVEQKVEGLQRTVRPHELLREPILGRKSKHRVRTPAMADGLTDRVLTVGKILRI